MNIYVEQQKFHQIMLKKYYISPIVKEKQTIRKFLCYYQELGCQAYPTEAKMNSILGELYDAKFHIYLTNFGSYSLFVYSLCAIDPSYINDPKYTLRKLEKTFELLVEAKMNTSSANQKLFKRAYEIFESDLLNLKENTQVSAIEKAISYYFKGTQRDFSKYGTLEDLEKITPKDLYSYYQRLKQEETISIGTGRGPFIEDKEKITLIPKRNYLFKQRGTPQSLVTEKCKSNQCYLNLIYETETFADDPLYFACSCLNHILGGDGSSTLFQKVRETYGLCYSIHSTYFGASGIFLITCVLDPRDVEKGIRAIDEAIEEISKLEFDLEKVKAIFISNKLLQEDYLETAIENYISDTYFLDTPKSNEEIEGYASVTKEDILKVYKRLKKSFTYILGGKLHAKK